MVNINFKKKDLWLLSAIVVFLVGVGFVIAFGDYSGNEAQINGHSSDEIMVKDTSGNLVTLQSLIDSGELGGGSVKSYVSPWTYLAAGSTSGNINHGLNSNNLIVTIWVNSVASDSGAFVSDWSATGAGYVYSGVQAQIVDSNNIKVASDRDGLGWKGSNIGTNIGSGYFKVVVIAAD